LYPKGLTEHEVKERIRNGQQNKLSKPKTKTAGEIIIENLFSVFNLVIFAIIVFLLYFYLTTHDDRLWLDSIGVMLIAVINTLLAIIQELKAKRALDKVNLLLKRKVKVVRDGKESEIEPYEIVKDDTLKLGRGDQVVVDGIVEFTNHLEIDESLLTGESNPILKKEGQAVLSGSFCLSGSGYYRADKIGMDSYASQVTMQAKKYKFDLTPLQKQINFIVKALFGVALLLVLLAIILNKDGFNTDFVRKISTIVMSLVPQGLVLMSTVTFAVGVYRISKLGAIVQRLNAIESFSNVQVVCMDKTGTLTQNKLTLRSIIPVGSNTEEEARTLAGTYASLTSDKNATAVAISELKPGDGYKLIDEFPFSSERKLSMVEVESGSGKSVLILGGYDILMDNVMKDKSGLVADEYAKANLSLYRNLLLGKVTNFGSVKEAVANIDNVEIDPACIISITDKIRDDVFDAIKLFTDNGIKLKILSGDSAKAVQEVASEIGWKISDDELVSGDEIENADDTKLKEIVTEKTIFARLKPEHKLRIIKSLKSQKIYTAMIGDGVNDLPAIKESNMGIAMEEGSAITKEVADIVLLQNKFSLLPKIFDEGNLIVNSVMSVGKLFITKNFFVIYITLLSILFLLEFPLTPRRVSLINIFGIGLPAFMITMKNLNVSKTTDFIKELFSFVLLSAAIIVAAGYIGVYFAGKFYQVSEKDLQMIMLTIMIITNIANYFSIVLTKEEASNKLVYVIYGFIILLLYIFLAATNIQSGAVLLVKAFYEIDFVRPVLWPMILVISLISSFVLFYAQKLRKKIMYGT
jgi:cation-transporting ATPase E